MIRFSLRALFVLLLLCSFICAIYVWARRQQERVDLACEELYSRNFTIDRLDGGSFRIGLLRGWTWDRKARAALLELGDIHTLSISGPLISDSGRHLLSLPGLRCFEMQYGHLSSAEWETLTSKARWVEDIQITSSTLPLDRLDLLANMPRLRRLRLDFEQAGDEIPSHLPPVLEIHTIGPLNELDARYNGALHVHSMPHVRAMDLSYGPRIVSDDNRNHFRVSTCPRLSRLRVRHPHSLTGIAVQPSLAELDIVYGPIHQADVHHLTGFGSLRSLSFEDNWLTPEAVQSLTKLQYLEELTLVNISIERPDVATVEEVEQDPNNNDLRQIASVARHCGRLHTLRLDRMEISSPDALDHL